jgi:predicted thioesterase
MERFQPGQSADLEAEVTKELTINRMGREGADVLSTPALLDLMERACIKASDPYLPSGYTTVGYAVDGLRHLAPTAIGRKVRVKSVLTEVDRNRLSYSIEAFEGDKKIGVATHKRAAIPKDSNP